MAGIWRGLADRDEARAENADAQKIEAFLTDITPGLGEKVSAMAIREVLPFGRQDLVER